MDDASGTQLSLPLISIVLITKYSQRYYYYRWRGSIYLLWEWNGSTVLLLLSLLKLATFMVHMDI